MSKYQHVKSFLHKRHSFLFLLGYIIIIAEPMPIYSSIVPVQILFPLLFTMPILIVAFLVKGRLPSLTLHTTQTPLLAWLVWSWLAIGWASVVILTYAMTVDKLYDNRSALSWWIGSSLGLFWFACLGIASWAANRRQGIKL